MTNLPGYRLLSSTSNKQILFNRTKWTHCRNICAAGQIQNILGHSIAVTVLPRQNITVGLIEGLRWEEGTLDFNMTLNSIC